MAGQKIAFCALFTASNNIFGFFCVETAVASLFTKSLAILRIKKDSKILSV